jgi:hypothetical protein
MDWAPVIALILVIIGLVGFVIVCSVAVFGGPETLNSILMKNPAANVGIPCSALAAFVIVSTLLKVFPPKEDGGPLMLKFFGLEFTGPAGPISLWIACFLALILSVNMLKLDRSANVAKSPDTEAITRADSGIANKST